MCPPVLKLWDTQGLPYDLANVIFVLLISSGTLPYPKGEKNRTYVWYLKYGSISKYGYYSTIVDLVNMESVPKITALGLNMMVKNGLESFILKSLHVEETYFYY